ncbi:TonB-dependent siderophore receptor [Alteromonas oceanisediminis]|uniref:TonB-dependent siderophore receptor n=1 Tax=Alteromonas oceanisediminis TaxID=2836180 RepID=UPI001BDB487E|nr:TonB-dependent receptor [Alteromonas oceanisediminis]MBT0586825.1 TonB-dependent receptor [Alteromonas oceanisediminis]
MQLTLLSHRNATKFASRPSKNKCHIAILASTVIAGVPCATANPQQSDAESNIEVVEVVGNKYRPQEASSLGFGLEMDKLPASIAVLSSDFIKNSQTDRLRDLLTYIQGVTLSDDGGWTADGIIIRGFDTNGQLYFDGVKQTPLTIRPNFATIERVEVLKGAASADFGVTEPGGVINIIRKKPFNGQAGSLNVSAGSFGQREATLDMNSAFLAEGQLQTRLIASYTESAEWRQGRKDNDNIYDFVIAPSMRYAYSETGDVILAYEKVYQADPQDRGIIYVEDAFEGGFAPRDWSWHQNSGEQVNRIDRLTLEWQDQVTSDLAIRALYSYTDYHYVNREYRNANTEFRGNGLSPYSADGRSWNGNTTFEARYAFWDSQSDTTNLKFEMEYDFSLGNVENAIIAGWRKFDTEENGAFFDTQVEGNTTVNLFNPDPNGLSTDVTVLPDPFLGGQTIEETGYFAKLLTEFSPKFRTLLSAQYTEFEGDSFGDISQSDDVSIRVAGSYDIHENFTLFTGYSDAFLPQGGVTRAGEMLSPTHDKSYEIGVKASLFDSRVLWTSSLFHTNRSDIVASDPTNDDDLNEFFVINFGEVEISGFETEFAGRVSDQFNVRVGFSLLDSEIIKTDTGPFEGNEFANTADLQISGFADYNFARFELPRLTATLGVIHIGERQGNSGNTIQLPAYTTVDIGLNYAVSERLELFAFASNVFDDTVILSMQDSGTRSDQVDVGNRSLFRVGAKYQF